MRCQVTVWCRHSVVLYGLLFVCNLSIFIKDIFCTAALLTKCFRNTQNEINDSYILHTECCEFDMMLKNQRLQKVHTNYTTHNRRTSQYFLHSHADTHHTTDCRQGVQITICIAWEEMTDTLNQYGQNFERIVKTHGTHNMGKSLHVLCLTYFLNICTDANIAEV